GRRSDRANSGERRDAGQQDRAEGRKDRQVAQVSSLRPPCRPRSGDPMTAAIHRLVVLGIVSAAVLSLPTPVSNRALDDWPQWRGPNRDGVSAERGLLKDWPAGGPPLVWKTGGAGEGYSSFSTANGRLFTLGARGGTEYVIAFDAATGKRLWESEHGQRFSNDRGDGPRATPTIEGD